MIFDYEKVEESPMPTSLDAPGVFHHVMIRGIEGEKYFGIIKQKCWPG